MTAARSIHQLAATDWDAIVIGAGPAGSVAARQIALAGPRVLLLDKKSFPRHKVCGACLNQSSVGVLDDIGLGAAVRELNAPQLTHFDLRSGSRRLSLSLPSGLAVSRAALDQLLANEAVRAGAIFRDEVTAAVGDVEADRRIVHVRCSDKTDGVYLRAKVVLVADGLGHPSLSGLQEVTERQTSHSRMGAGCVLKQFPDEYIAGTIHMAVGQGGYVGLVRVESGELNLAAAFDPAFVRESSGLAMAAKSVRSPVTTSFFR